MWGTHDAAERGEGASGSWRWRAGAAGLLGGFRWAEGAEEAGPREAEGSWAAHGRELGRCYLAGVRKEKRPGWVGEKREGGSGLGHQVGFGLSIFFLLFYFLCFSISNQLKSI